MSEAAKPFADNWDYLKVELNWVDRLLQLAVARQRKETKVIDRVAQTKGDRVTSHWWKGLVALDGQVTYDTPPDDHPTAARAAPKPGYQQQLEARIQASAHHGIPLGLPTLRDRLHLTKFEKNLVLLALAPEVNQRHARLFAYLQGQDQAQLPSVNLVLKLLCANDAEWRVAREQLAATSPLRHLALVQLLPEHTGSFLGRSVKLADDLVNYLLAETPTPAQLEHLLQPPVAPAISPGPPPAIVPAQSPVVYPPPPRRLPQGQPPVSWSDLVLPASLLHHLQALALPDPDPDGPIALPPLLPGSPLGTIALFVGAAGTGKTMAAAAIAHHRDQPLTWVDLATVSPAADSDILAAILAQAPAILLLRSAHLWFGPRARVTATALTTLCQHRRQWPSLTILTVAQQSEVRLKWQRQCDRILTFPAPDTIARRHLWQQAFATTLPPIATLDWHTLAQIPSLTGGEIRQIVQMATSLATVTEASAVDRDHLITALEQWRQQLPLAEAHARHLDRLDWTTVVRDLPTAQSPPRRKRTSPGRARAKRSLTPPTA